MGLGPMLVGQDLWITLWIAVENLARFVEEGVALG